jgi:hypothetical protein
MELDVAVRDEPLGACSVENAPPMLDICEEAKGPPMEFSPDPAPGTGDAAKSGIEGSLGI